MASDTVQAAVWALATVGGVLLLAQAARAGVAFYRAFLRQPHDLLARYGEGSWACVTGATDGIGKATAYELARRGVNVLLVSRTQSKLDETKEELAGKTQVKIETLQVDFGNWDPAVVGKALQAYDVAILVNNVGVSYEYPTYFHELDDARVADMIKLNIDSTTEMTRLLLPAMLNRRGGKRKGAIVNVGSAAGILSSPFLTQYSAAKAYVERLSEGLAVEYASKGIDVQCHTPFFIVSKLSKIRKSSLMTPTSESYGRALVDRIGYETVVNPHLGHAFMGYALRLVPAFVRESYTRSLHLGIRAKALKKKGGETKKDE